MDTLLKYRINNGESEQIEKEIQRVYKNVEIINICDNNVIENCEFECIMIVLKHKIHNKLFSFGYAFYVCDYNVDDVIAYIDKIIVKIKELVNFIDTRINTKIKKYTEQPDDYISIGRILYFDFSVDLNEIIIYKNSTGGSHYVNNIEELEDYIKTYYPEIYIPVGLTIKSAK